MRIVFADFSVGSVWIRNVNPVRIFLYIITGAIFRVFLDIST